MSTQDQLREEDEAYEGDNIGSFVGAPEGFLSRSLSRADTLLQRVSLTPGPRPPSREEQLQEDSSGDPLAGSSSVLRDLSTTLEMAGDSDAATAVPAVAASMFKSLDPTPKEEFAQGACELPRTSRGDDAKTIKKNKDACCVGLKQKYELNSFQFTGSNQEDEDDTSPAARSTQDTLLSMSYKNGLMYSALKACDALNGVLVPRLFNANGTTPAVTFSPPGRKPRGSTDHDNRRGYAVTYEMGPKR